MTSQLVEACSRLPVRPLPPEYDYSCVPLAVCDAVFSIGARYEAVVRPIVTRFADFLNVPLFGIQQAPMSPKEGLRIIGHLSDATMASQVFKNRQRTSSRNGVLKSCAVRMWLEALSSLAIERFQDVHGHPRLFKAVARIPGQSKRPFEYFLMLAGDTGRIKCDRHIIAFCTNFGGAAEELPSIAKALGREPRELDYSIWFAMSNKDFNLGHFRTDSLFQLEHRLTQPH